MFTEKVLPSLVNIKTLIKWPSVKNKVYNQEEARDVFNAFFRNDGSERAIGSSLLCKDLTPEKREALEKLGINLKDQFNVRVFNAGLLDDLDEELAEEVKIYWQKHYGAICDVREGG